MRRGLTLVCVLLLTGWSLSMSGQVATTTVQDTVYRADGTPAGGTVVVSWNAFTTAGGQSVPAGSTSATIGAGGLVSLSLAPNAGSTPMGSYYTAVFHLNDGTTSREYWVIPVSVPGGAPAKLAAIRNQVLPASVAMQTVSKAYVDNAIASAAAGFPGGNAPYIVKAGDSMSGPLLLPGDPVSAYQAADKNYVDTNIATVAAGLTQKLSMAPSSTQRLIQPSGTELQVNHLNGDLAADQYVSGNGNNGIANALGSSDCASGCVVRAGTDYASAEQVNAGAIPANSQVVDARGGAQVETTVNPLPPGEEMSAAHTIHQVETITGQQYQAAHPGAVGVGVDALQLVTDAQAGGSNQYPEQVETPPYSKSTYGTLQMVGHYNTQGQHVQLNNFVNCYAVGDCLAGGQFIVTSGGYRDSADEGAHPWDLSISEDTAVFTGTCSSGCTTGSTSLGLTNLGANGTQGDGRFLIDKNPAAIINAGAITSGGRGIFGFANFSGTNFPVSVFLATAAAATSQGGNLAPGAVSLPILTSAVPSGFSTSTAGLPASSGIACVADPVFNGTMELPNYEMAHYSVVDSSHLTLTLNKVHMAGAVVAVGGLCGYGLEQTVDTTNGLRQVFPVVGSTAPGSLYYSDAGTTVVGNMVPWNTSGYQNINLGIAAITRQGNVTTVTIAGKLPADVNGLTMTVSGVSDASYNGSFQITTTGPSTLTYTNSGVDGASSGGTVGLLTGGFALYPMAEVLSVLNPGTKQIDGQMTLAPNTVAWAPGDPVEQPHYYQEYTYGDTEYVTQFVPRPLQNATQGKSYFGLIGPGFRGWQISNAVPASMYLGAGGTHQQPDDAYQATGVWNNDLEVDAGENAVIQVHCNLHGCNRWNSKYYLFQLDSTGGQDALSFDPLYHVASWLLGGQNFSFSPGGFSANTINAGALNATVVNSNAGGDLSGNLSNPTVNAVHAVSGTLDGVAIGGKSPASAAVTSLNSSPGNCTDCVAATFTSAGSVATDMLLTNTSPGGHAFAFFSTGSGNGPGYFGVYDSTAGAGPLAITGGVKGGPATVAAGSTTVIGWSSVSNAFSAPVDTGFTRESSGVVDCGNGTPGDASCTLKAGKIAAGNGYTGTKTIGSCTLVIQSGIITNVTGC